MAAIGIRRGFCSAGPPAAGCARAPAGQQPRRAGELHAALGAGVHGGVGGHRRGDHQQAVAGGDHLAEGQWQRIALALDGHGDARQRGAVGRVQVDDGGAGGGDVEAQVLARQRLVVQPADPAAQLVRADGQRQHRSGVRAADHVQRPAAGGGRRTAGGGSAPGGRAVSATSEPWRSAEAATSVASSSRPPPAESRYSPSPGSPRARPSSARRSATRVPSSTSTRTAVWRRRSGRRAAATVSASFTSSSASAFSGGQRIRATAATWRRSAHLWTAQEVVHRPTAAGKRSGLFCPRRVPLRCVGTPDPAEKDGTHQLRTAGRRERPAAAHRAYEEDPWPTSTSPTSRCRTRPPG